MRRGLMKWEESELPVDILTQRTARLQAALKLAGFDGLVIYTNNVRPAAVQYLTAFTPYWSDAILLLPTHGPSVFATSLSKRVLNWIRSTNPVSDIVNTPRPGVVVGERLAGDKGVKRIGVLEFDMLPFGIFEDLTHAAPDVEFADATNVFAAVRQQLDGAEIALIGKTDERVRAALEIGPAPGVAAGALLGGIEAGLRGDGAEEVYLAIAPDLRRATKFLRNPGEVSVGEIFAISASVAFKGCWVRRTRSFGDQAGFARAETWWRGLRFGSKGTIGRQVRAGVGDLPGARLVGWTAECCVGSYPLQVVEASGGADPTLPAGSMVVVNLALEIDGTNWMAAGPFIIGDG
jgi:hypothetical protein